MVDCGGGLGVHILHADRLGVQQIGDLLVGALLLVDAGRVRVVLSLAGRALVDADGKQEGRGVLSPHRGQDFVAAVLDDGQLSSVAHEARVESVEEVFLRLAVPVPLDLGGLASIQIRQDEGIVRVGNNVTIDPRLGLVVDVDLGDLLAELALDHVRVLLALLPDEDLTRADVGKLEDLLVGVPSDAGIVEVEKAAERSDGEAGAVVLPGHGRDGVHVLNNLDFVLVPRVRLGVVAEGVVAVEVSDGDAVPSIVEARDGELLAFRRSLRELSSVVEGPLPATFPIVEGHALVVAGGADTSAPRQRVRDGRVRAYFRVRRSGEVRVGKVVAEDASIKVGGDDSGSVRVGGEGHTVRLGVVQSLRLVASELSDLHLALREAVNDLEGVVRRPDEGGDGGGASELVADGLLALPDGFRGTRPLVDEDDVVALCDGQLGLRRIRAKVHCPDQVILGPLIVRLGAELVHPLAIRVIDADNAVGGYNGETRVVGGKANCGNTSLPRGRALAGLH
mmetsp:Transcript_20204/g.37697  ORF Transcript_20204/g.37697 Transcript_20204/m.37697 type:complete len:508 (+) Transcript_20204:3860-5383(+)